MPFTPTVDWQATAEAARARATAAEAALKATAEAAATHLKAKMAAESEIRRLRAQVEQLQLNHPVERRTLLEVRSFITKHGRAHVDAYCQQRLHDMAMDARHEDKEPRA
jgi:regulator of protease activity HflC (stomatin/prohibitin superfamily)